MQIIRLKMGPARNKEWACCFGLHVRTATIMIGVWHLVRLLEVFFQSDKETMVYQFK